jgi:hypothetical protein
MAHCNRSSFAGELLVAFARFSLRTPGPKTGGQLPVRAGLALASQNGQQLGRPPTAARYNPASWTTQPSLSAGTF